ncbi:hypothetical protein P7C73_g6625, partial [Tremellales sp. Uapishka_1]
MPPSPGKIHSLPIKVLYSIDTSPQSYLTILNDKHDVYVHPSTLAYGADTQGLLGSCTLKSIARAICFSSPECIPNQTLDFSLYNLDPRITSSISSAFPNQEAPAPVLSSCWTGKGFLSWVLKEDSGETLVKGRLVREYEFANCHFNDRGGLEGLLAANAGRGEGMG